MPNPSNYKTKKDFEDKKDLAMTPRIKTGKLTRTFELDTRELDKEKRTIPLSFSSEEPVDRFFGTEILDHAPESVRMNRLKKGVPVLLNHDRDKQIGILENPQIASDRKGRGIARFGQSQLANEVWQDIQDGIRKDVSVGYRIHHMVLQEEKEGFATYRATDWEPLEVSIVSVPADINVGIGRGEGTDYEILIDKKEKHKMSDEPKVTPPVDASAMLEDAARKARDKEIVRTSEIMAMGQKAGRLDDALKFVREGKSIDEFRNLILDAALANLKPTVEVGQDRSEKEPWKCIGEYFFAVRFMPGDPRLRSLFREKVGESERAMSMGIGSAGGFAVPAQFGAMLQEVPPEEALFRAKSFVVPAGDPPDAKITFPAIDIGTSHGRYGGVSGNWIGEGVTKPETTMFLREIELEPKEYAARIIVTDKLIRNWAAASSVIERMMRGAVIAAEEMAFIGGNGIGKPVGVNTAANTAAIFVTRNGANAIDWVDVYTMFRRILRQGGGSPFWATSASCLSQLISMADDGSSLVWHPSAREGMPSTLMGYPLYIYDRLPALGTAGDLMLLNLNPYYYIKDGSGPFFAASEHVYFETNKTVFKVFINVDGQPALKEAIPVEGNTAVAYTVSPFIILN